MNEKITYQAPEAELVEISIGKGFLDTSVGSTSAESMSGINGSWDD